MSYSELAKNLGTLLLAGLTSLSTPDALNYKTSVSPSYRAEAQNSGRSAYATKLLSWLDDVESSTGIRAPEGARSTISSGRLSDKELDAYTAGIETAYRQQVSKAPENKDHPVYWLSEEDGNGNTRIRNLYGPEVFWLSRGGSSFNIGLSTGKLEEKFGGRGLLSGIYQMVAPDGSYLHDVKKAA